MEYEEGEDETENEEEDEQNAGVIAEGGNVTDPTESSSQNMRKKMRKLKEKTAGRG